MDETGADRRGLTRVGLPYSLPSTVSSSPQSGTVHASTVHRNMQEERIERT